MPEVVHGKIFVNGLKKRDLLGEKCVLVFLDLPGESTHSSRESAGSEPMLVWVGKLSPYHFPACARTAAEHMGVDAAAGKPLVINPTLSAFKKPAGSGRVVVHPECIPGNIKHAVLVAELRVRCRFIRLQDRSFSLSVTS